MAESRLLVRESREAGHATTTRCHYHDTAFADDVAMNNLIAIPWQQVILKVRSL